VPSHHIHPIINLNPALLHDPPSRAQVYLHWITYLRYVSAVYFGFQGVAANEFEGVFLPCDTPGAAAESGSIGAWIGRSFPNTSNAQRRQLEVFFQRYSRTGGCVFDPSSTLDHYNINRAFWVNAGILFGYLGVLHVATFAAMVFTGRRERR